MPAIEGALLGSHPALSADLVHALALSAKRARIAIRGATDQHSSCRYGCASTSTNLTVGADIHRPTAKLVEQVVLRDRVCRFPGCRHPARHSDLDHRRPFAEGGPTTAENLDALCRFHHRLKTFTRWRAIREPGNRMTWSTPLGATITDDPELTPPAPSPHAPDDDPPPF
ncbi:MAG: HNH endonuclease signature motif containing protein [Nakamurella sp.]